MNGDDKHRAYNLCSNASSSIRKTLFMLLPSFPSLLPFTSSLPSSLFSSIFLIPCSHPFSSDSEPKLEMETAISDTNVIIGDDLVLTCEASGEPEPSLTWYRNGLPINDTLQRFSLEENSLIIPILTSKMGGSYKCIYDNGVLTASSSAMIEILGRLT